MDSESGVAVRSDQVYIIVDLKRPIRTVVSIYDVGHASDNLKKCEACATEYAIMAPKLPGSAEFNCDNCNLRQAYELAAR